MAMFIAPVEAMLEEKGLGFLATAADIIIIFALAFALERLLTRLLRRVVRKKAGGAESARAKRLETAVTVLQSVVRYAVYFIAAALSLSELGFASSVRTLLTAAGVGGLVLGVGAQSLVSDVVAGFFLLTEDQFAVGDYIEAGGVTGTVEAVSIRTTTIRGYTGELNIVPNGSVKTLTNFSRTNTLAVVDVPVSIRADAKRALALLQEEADAYYKELGGIAAKPPETLGVSSARAGEQALRVVMLVKPLEHWAVQRELLRRALARFEREGIPFPYEAAIDAGAAQREDGDG